MKLKSPKNMSDLAQLLFGWVPERGWAFFLAVLGVASVILGLFAGGHHYFAIEEIPGFHGLFGFVAFALVVLSGWPLRRLLERRRNYYKEDD